MKLGYPKSKLHVLTVKLISSILHNKDCVYGSKSMTGTSGAPHAGFYTCLSLADQTHFMLQRVSEMFCLSSNLYLGSNAFHRQDIMHKSYS